MLRLFQLRQRSLGPEGPCRTSTLACANVISSTYALGAKFERLRVLGLLLSTPSLLSARTVPIIPCCGFLEVKSRNASDNKRQSPYSQHKSLLLQRGKGPGICLLLLAFGAKDSLILVANQVGESLIQPTTFDCLVHRMAAKKKASLCSGGTSAAAASQSPSRVGGRVF
jgi:hypothetical protein